MKYLSRLVVLFGGAVTSLALLSGCGVSDAAGVNSSLAATAPAIPVPISTMAPTPPPNDIIKALEERLRQKKIPVKQIVVTSQIPLKVEVILQSTSNGSLIAPDDPIFAGVAEQETIRARSRQFEIDAVKVTTVNSHGEPISWSEIPIREDKGFDVVPLIPSQASNETVAQAVRDQAPLRDLVVQRLDVDVSLDEYQTHVITMTLTVQDIAAANTAIPAVILTLPAMMQDLERAQGARIASYRVVVFDGNGQPLLKYIRYSLSSEDHEQWWQADGVTQNWFPHPAPTSGPENQAPPPTPAYPAPAPL